MKKVSSGFIYYFGGAKRLLCRALRQLSNAARPYQIAFSTVASGCLFVLIAMAALYSRAQIPEGASGRGFQYAYRDDKTRVLKAILTGRNAKQITGSQILLTEFKMRTLRDGDTNQVEVIAEAPECYLDRSTSVAWSAGPVKVYTAMTNLYIEGIGFFLHQSNAVLVISNKVHTVIHKESFKTSSAGKPSPAPAATNQILKIFSDQFRFLYESNLVIYSGNVRVEDAQMELTCDVLNIHFSTNKANPSIAKILADQHVVILNKKDKSRATGERAIYTMADGRELVELVGNPVWSDGQREGKAGKFIFDRTNNLFRAEQNAVFKIPRHQLGQMNILSPVSASTTNGDIGNFVTVSANTISIQMPPTNGPIQEIVADENVVIFSEGDQSRATGKRAVFREASGLMELTGNPVWKMKENEISADILVLGQTNQTFVARTNVHIIIPAASFGNTFSGGVTNLSAPTHQIVEVFSQDFSYNTNVATFRDKVMVRTVDANQSLTRLLCQFLQVSFGLSNQVETILANKEVFLEQSFGPVTLAKISQRSIKSDLLAVTRSLETGLTKKVRAEFNVVAQQNERTSTGDSVKRIAAEVVEITFLPGTNQIESVLAEQNVVVEKIQHDGPIEKMARARGQHAVYNSSSETAELTGQPTASSDNMFIHEGNTLRWDLRTGKIGAAGRSKVTPLNSTNAVRSLLQPKP